MATANGLPVSGIESAPFADGCVYGGAPGPVELVHCSATPTRSTSVNRDEHRAMLPSRRRWGRDPTCPGASVPEGGPPSDAPEGFAEPPGWSLAQRSAHEVYPACFVRDHRCRARRVEPDEPRAAAGSHLTDGRTRAEVEHIEFPVGERADVHLRVVWRHCDIERVAGLWCADRVRGKR